jgi:hypothetical protein
MDKYFTDVLGFIIILFILIGLFYYTKTTKESFFVTSESVPYGLTFVILDGKSSDDNGWNIYTNQLSDTCVDNCPNYLVNSNHTCSVNTQSDGNIVIYNSNGAVWASNTDGKGNGPYRAVMQQDGNYVLYDANNQPIWATGTNDARPPYKLIIQPNCNLVVYDKNYRPLWTSNTWDKSAGSISNGSSTNWQQIPGNLMSIAISPNGNIFGVNSEFNIFYKTPYQGQFVQLKGNLKTIDTDGSYICGITSDNNISCAIMNDALNGNYTTIGKNAKSVSVSNNTIYAVNLDNSLTYSTNISDLNNVKWNSVPITLYQFHSISLDGNVLVGINNNNELMYADNNIFSSKPNFTKINTLDDMKNFINITLYKTSILVTDTEGNLWYTSDYKNPNWQKIKTKGKTFMAVVTQSNNAITPMKVFGNNGSVSCEKYCSGIDGGPWNGELPVEWNGARCVDASRNVIDCNTPFNLTPDSYCVCAPTNNGWRNWP